MQVYGARTYSEITSTIIETVMIAVINVHVCWCNHYLSVHPNKLIAYPPYRVKSVTVPKCGPFVHIELGKVISIDYRIFALR